MKSETHKGNTKKIEREGEPANWSGEIAGEEAGPAETAADFDDDSDLDESDFAAADDDRWDVFILDGDEPLPEYGDFWFPD